MNLQTDLPTFINSGDNSGLGGGLAGGLLLGSLLRNGNYGYNNDRNRDDYGCVSHAELAAQLANVTDTQMNTTVLQSLGDIKASIPYAEGQVQLALAGSTGEIRSHLGAVENTLVQGQAGINQNISNGNFAVNQNVSHAIAASLASQNNILSTVLTSAAAGISATKADCK